MRFKRSKPLAVAAAVAAVLFLGACAAGQNNVAHVDAPQIAGFWPGLWHGFISPFTFVISLFNDNVNIYEVHNNGNWYNFGFMIGISVIFSGPARSGKNVRSSRRVKNRSEASD